jgi:hypothetical protein
LFSRREASEISLRVPTPAATRERLEIRARLTANGSGVSGSTIAFTANMLPLGASTTGPDGTATVVFSPRLAGRYNIRAHFLGDGRHAGSSATATITVVQGS